MPDLAHPFADTQAAQMLAGAIRVHTAKEPGGLRALAKKMGLKQATVLSHLANGRMPIPLERAPQFAQELKMNVEGFCRAVLAQRFPSISQVLEGALADSLRNSSPSMKRFQQLLEGEEVISDDRLNIIAEVLRDREPSERWLSLNEIATMKMLRKLRPEGLTEFERSKIWHDLSGAGGNSAG